LGFLDGLVHLVFNKFNHLFSLCIQATRSFVLSSIPGSYYMSERLFFFLFFFTSVCVSRSLFICAPAGDFIPTFSYRSPAPQLRICTDDFVFDLFNSPPDVGSSFLSGLLDLVLFKVRQKLFARSISAPLDIEFSSYVVQLHSTRISSPIFPSWRLQIIFFASEFPPYLLKYSLTLH